MKTLLQDLEQYITDYVSLPDPGYSLPLALWTIGTYAYLDFDAFPYLVITSATKRSGKTRLSELIGFTCSNPRQFAAMTGATVYRSIELEKPTLLIDEAESLSSEAASTMRSVLNVGYRKGQSIPRTDGLRMKQFDTYCPKLFVLIGSVFDTLRDRSIVITMQRAEPPSRFVFNIAKERGQILREQIAADVKKSLATIKDRFTNHKGLAFLMDRDEEIWTPLFVLCEIFAPSRVQELKVMAVDLATEKTAEATRYIQSKKAEEAAVDDEYAKKLLVDLYGLMLTGPKVMSSAGAVDALRAIPVAPWRKFKGDGIDAREISNMLSRFGVRPVRIALGSGRGNQKFLRGYRRQDLEKAMSHLRK